MGRKKYKKFHSESAEKYNYHNPVLLKQAIDYLVIKEDGFYIDGTLGGGGHAAEIINRLNKGGTLFAFDKDEEAIKHCRTKFAEELNRSDGKRIILRYGCFSEACGIEEVRGRLSGLLLDLGLSSRQLDESRRGFSYRADSKLDMRFSSHGKTAAELLNNTNEEELVKIFRNYGEEPFAGKIARRLLQRRRAAPLETTFGLRAVIEESVPTKLLSKSLSRIFQAVRIAVNDELNLLTETLQSTLELFEPGGRIVIISYHSLEDRIVKNFFKEHQFKLKNVNELEATNMPKLNLLNILTKKPIIPDENELISNPRARSAKMRVAEIV